MRALLWLAVANETVLEKCDEERRKLAALGALVAMSAFLAAFAVTGSTVMFIGLPLAEALPLGISWGACIMALDRFLIISIRRQRTWLRTVALALPRISVAVVAGLVFAVSLLLSAFHTEVRAKAGENKQQALQQGRVALDHRFGEIPALEKQVLELSRAVPIAGSHLLSNSAFRAASEEAAKLHAQALAAEAQATCELDGTCGTHHVGPGSVYKAKMHHAEELERQAQAAEERENELRGAVLGEEASFSRSDAHSSVQERSTVQARLQALREKRKHGEERLEKEYAGTPGMLDRLDALFDLGYEHPVMGVFASLVALLLMLLDVSAALGKLALVLGEPGLYEQELAKHEQFVADRNDAQRLAELEAEKISAQSRCNIEGLRAAAQAERLAASRLVEEEELKNELWRSRRRQLVERVVGIEAELADRAIEVYRKRAAEEFDRNVQSALSETWTATEPARAARAAARAPSRTRRWPGRARRRRTSPRREE
jgi:Domain of unknown function (DUF4407)